MSRQFGEPRSLPFPYSVSMYLTRRNVKRMYHLYAFASIEQQLPSECLDRITKPILTTDSTSDSEDSAIESYVERTTRKRKRKRIAGNIAVHDVRITIRFAGSYS